MVSVSLLILGVSACGESSGGSGKSDSKTIGVQFATMNSTFMTVVNDALYADAKKAGLSALSTGNAEYDMAKQATEIRNNLNQGVAGMIVVPADAAGIVPSLKLAADKDVPVVTMDEAPNSGPLYMSVRTDNVDMGDKACSALAKSVGEKGTVVEVQGSLASSTGRERHEGFSKCMESNYPDIKVLTVAGEWDAQKAGQDLGALLASNPDLDGIYLHSGGAYLAATLEGLKRQGMLFPTTSPKHVSLVANDGTPEELDAIRDGFMDATVSQPAKDYAQYAVKYIQDAINGVKQKTGPTDHDSTILELPSGILEDRLLAPLVEKKNVDDPALWGNQS